MTQDELVKEYNAVVGRALTFFEKAKREGFLALEDELDRDIFEYGMQLALDGRDAEAIERKLSSLIEQEKDENLHLLKTIQKDAVLVLQKGENPMRKLLSYNKVISPRKKTEVL
jgi:flagellar motor component MotA